MLKIKHFFIRRIGLVLLVSLCVFSMFVPTSTFAQTPTCTNPNDPAKGFLIDPDGNTTTVPCCPLDSNGQCVQTKDPDTGKDTNLRNDGIFGCLGLGAQVANVGTTNAIGGVYVPVNDASVTLNTGFLVYKECILDGVTRKIAENVSSEYTKQQLQAFNEGREGNAQYLVNWSDLNPRRLGIVAAELQRITSSTMCDAFKRPVQSNLARSYLRAINEPARIYTCPFASSGGASSGFTFGSWFQLIRPSGNIYGITAETQSYIDRLLSEDDRNIRQMLDWGRGTFSRTDNAADPLQERVITPGFIIADAISQVIGSGFRQLENASEIDQVVGNLFGGLTTQLVADTRGLSGLSQSFNGQPSYLDRMTAQTASNVRTQAANAALNIISAARQIETTYKAAKEAIATALGNAIQELRSAEEKCWELIIPAVESYAQQNGNPTLTIATSTRFSQQIIDAQIAPLATTTIQEIRASDAALTLLNQLISSVSNSASQANQQQALLRLDTMVANRQLHTATDATNAGQQRDSVLGALTTLVEDTIKAWADDNDANIGWCNINNTAVIQRWFNEWQ